MFDAAVFITTIPLMDHILLTLIEMLRKVLILSFFLQNILIRFEKRKKIVIIDLQIHKEGHNSINDWMLLLLLSFDSFSFPKCVLKL